MYFHRSRSRHFSNKTNTRGIAREFVSLLKPLGGADNGRVRVAA